MTPKHGLPESVLDEVDGIAGYLCSLKLQKGDTIGLATLRYKFLDFTLEEVGEAQQVWRDVAIGPYPVLDFSDVDLYRELKLRTIDLMGACTWDALRTAEDRPVAEILECLGIALRIQLMNDQIPYEGHRDLEALSDAEIDLGICLVGRLFAACLVNPLPARRLNELSELGDVGLESDDVVGDALVRVLNALQGKRLRKTGLSSI